jgi:hypothetical protein
MIILEATRRTSRAAVERLRQAFIEYDRIVFKEVHPPAEDAYKIVRQGRHYVVTLNDPTIP